MERNEYFDNQLKLRININMLYKHASCRNTKCVNSAPTLPTVNLSFM